MKTYELTYIITPEITLEEAEGEAKKTESLIQQKEGVIIKQTSPVAKTLAYAIKKQRSGFLGNLEFQIEPERLEEIKEVLSKDGKIIRSMLTIKKLLKQKKERRTKPISISKTELETEVKNEKGEERKVELRDIEEKLDEILGK
jgi:ribosomal protein S6